MQLTNTFKDELTSSLKQYTLCNANDSSISLLHRMIFTKEESFANCKCFAFCIFHVVVHLKFFS